MTTKIDMQKRIDELVQQIADLDEQLADSRCREKQQANMLAEQRRTIGDLRVELVETKERAARLEGYRERVQEADERQRANDLMANGLDPDPSVRMNRHETAENFRYGGAGIGPDMRGTVRAVNGEAEDRSRRVFRY